jgi:hypothetical protein
MMDPTECKFRLKLIEAQVEDKIALKIIKENAFGISN